jgi:hypothetical protein
MGALAASLFLAETNPRQVPVNQAAAVIPVLEKARRVRGLAKVLPTFKNIHGVLGLALRPGAGASSSSALAEAVTQSRVVSRRCLVLSKPANNRGLLAT